ncbi:MAG: hypothetical protein AAGD32_00650 [Planctomycetota bacterium]
MIRFAVTATPAWIMFAVVGLLYWQTTHNGWVLEHGQVDQGSLVMSIARWLTFLALFATSFGVPLVVGLFTLLKPAFIGRIGFKPALVLYIGAWLLVVPAFYLLTRLPGDYVAWLIGTAR